MRSEHDRTATRDSALGTALDVLPDQHVVLVGLMGSGKTTVGRVLASWCGRPFVDNDALLARRAGRTARELEASDGVDALHDAEVAALVVALASPEPAVVAAAAAAPLDRAATEAMRRHFVVYLRADPHVLAARLERDRGSHRPFADRDLRELLGEQHAQRHRAYETIADLVVDTSNVRADAVVGAISEVLAAARGCRGSPGS
jgi:shikimate kinase